MVMDKSRLVLLLLLQTLTLFAAAGGSNRYARIDIANAGETLVDRIKSQPDLDWWVELGEEMLVYGPESALTALAGLRPTIVLAVAPIPALLRFAAGEHDPGAGVELAQGGRFSVVQLAQPQVTGPTDRGHGEGLLPFRPNAVLAAMAENRPMAGKQKRRENAIEELLGQIDKVRWFADIFKLQGYDRHVDNPEIHDARD